MSIFDDVSRRPPAGIRLFVDRHGPCRDFAARINVDPPRPSIQFFVGAGGNGKSTLLRTLRDLCCYRLTADQWAKVAGYDDAFFLEALRAAPGARKVPVAFLDLGAQPHGVNRPQEPLGALFMLKRQLAEYGIRTPCFDFAAVSYLQRSGAYTRDLIEELFPPAELAALGALIEIFVQMPVFQVGTALYNWVDSRLDNLAQQRRMRRRVPRETVEEVLSLPPEPDLMEALPRIFAGDIRTALTTGRKRPSRIVLLIDTYEAVAGDGQQSRFSGVGGPRWIRSLLGNLPLRDGLVVVVAGRATPTWSQALTEPIPEQYVQVDALGPLPDRFARSYLDQAGLDDGPLRDALLRYAAVEPGLVHPLLLGLATDLALTLRNPAQPLRPEEFTGSAELAARERELAARLLSRVTPDLEDAVAAVAAARSFDHQTFTRLGTRLGFPVTASTFRRLTAFSFVTAHPDSRRFSIHQLVRRAVAAVVPELVRDAHQVLADYYTANARAGSFLDRVEQIYHTTALDAEAGMRAWTQEMDRALAISRFDRCRSLLGVIDAIVDLGIPPSATDAFAAQVVRADIALGRWQEAAQRLGSMPDTTDAHLLRSQLAFVRGDFDTAVLEVERALDAAGEGAARLPSLLMSAELMLFLGQFDRGRQRCREGLRIARSADDPNEPVRWLIKLATINFFAGDIQAAKDGLAEAERRIAEIPQPDLDRNTLAGLWVEKAVVAEAEDRPLDARHGQGQALRIRREIADIRGSAHALNGLGLAALQLGDADEAERCFLDSAAIARDLGEKLLYAKVTRGRAEAAVLAGRLDDADRLAAEALAGFEEAAIPYDVAHGWITQARVRRARGDEQGWLELVDRARRRIESEGFGSLYARCPEIRPPTADRIGAAMTAFAAGDALGVPWEGSSPEAIDRDAVASVPAAPWGWPQGSTSDDTAQVMLVAELLADTEGRPTPEEFVARLAAIADEIRGLGPTTRAALAEFTATGRLPAPAPGRRPTNGAAMRILPVGWVTPATDADLRRRRVEALAVGTHRAPVAIGAAQVIAAMGAWAVEGVGRDTILAAADQEVAWLGRHDVELSAVRAALAGLWRPPVQGVGLDADETAAAVVHVIREADDDLGSALLQAVYLGGDTDTVAAIVGGILGAAAPEQVRGLPWLPLVDHEPPSDLAGRLADLRRAWYLR